MQIRRLSCIAGLFVASSFVVPAVTQTPTPASPPSAKPASEPAMQLPPDQRAYQAARAIVDEDQRAKALRAFLKEFPESTRAQTARHLLFKLLLDHSAENKRQIHELAQSIVDHADKKQRDYAERYVAYWLAEALPNGIDLKAAEAWARDGVNLSPTLSAVTARMKESYEKYKEPMPSDAEIHDYWASDKADSLQALGVVYFHEGMLVEASATLDQAQLLNPTDGSILRTRGQIAHARKKDAEALDDLELAAGFGGLNPATQPLLVELYSEQHNGDVSGLEAEIDKRYLSLQKPFSAPMHAAPTTGRTVLLELFTGSACDPCVAADLSLDGVLEAYPRSEVVALSFDQHIPAPDPLANADTVARFKYASGEGTPSLRIDGQAVEHVYGNRVRVQKSFENLSKAIDTDLTTPSGVTLQLTATLTSANTIAASASVRVEDEKALKALLSAKPKPDPLNGGATEKGTSAKAAPAVEASKLVLNFALVQKEVRYSGENGIRFHSMVVRSMAKPSLDGFPVSSDGQSSVSFNFNPGTVSASLSAYLEAFAKHDDRFGTTHFLMTDTSLPMDQLAIAAWVEDPATHKVVAAAFAPVDAALQKASR